MNDRKEKAARISPPRSMRAALRVIEPMADKIPHHANLRATLQRGAEHLKQAIDCGVMMACLLLEDRACDQGEASTRIVTEIAPDDAGELLTTTQLAKRLNYSTRTIQQFKAEGMPYIGEGRSTRFELSKALEWLKQRSRKNNRVSMAANGKVPSAPIKTRLQASQRR